jgi:hypothetical protein
MEIEIEIEMEFTRREVSEKDITKLSPELAKASLRGCRVVQTTSSQFPISKAYYAYLQIDEMKNLQQEQEVPFLPLVVVLEPSEGQFQLDSDTVKKRSLDPFYHPKIHGHLATPR